MVKEGKWAKSDWERQPLKRQQVEYAALDAYAALAVYEEMKRRENQQRDNAVPDGDPLTIDETTLLELQEEDPKHHNANDFDTHHDSGK